MKLAFLSHEPFYPPSGGGSAEAVYLVEELVRRGHQVHLFCPQPEDAAGIEKRWGVRVHPFTAWRMGRYAAWRNIKYLLYPFFLERLVARALPAERFAAVLSQHAIAAVAAGRLKRRFGLITVMNYLDFLTGFMETWPAYAAPRPVLRRLEAFELSLPRRYGADGVLTVSDTLADYFVKAGYPRDRLCPIYYGYDAGLFPAPAGDGRPEPSPPVLVMHGSFDQHHLGPVAWDALQQLAAAQPGIIFRFVGQRTPTLDQFLRRAARCLPAAQLENPGFVSYATVPQHLASATLGLVPYEESRGTHCAFVAKLVEYLGLGLPVVCTPLDGVRRYFHDEPLVRFSGFDGASFGAGVMDWLRTPWAERQVLGRAASRRVRERLDWRVISGAAVTFVERVVNRH